MRRASDKNEYMQSYYIFYDCQTAIKTSENNCFLFTLALEFGTDFSNQHDEQNVCIVHIVQNARKTVEKLIFKFFFLFCFAFNVNMAKENCKPPKQMDPV